jgi:Tfp pilus assembly protein FimT
LRTAAWQIAHDLRLARQKAVTTGRRHRVCFSGCGSPVPVNGYLIQRQDGAVWQLDQMVPSPQDGLEVRSNATLTFAETGEAAGGTITISSAWGSYQVRAHFTGRVRVCQGTCQ